MFLYQLISLWRYRITLWLRPWGRAVVFTSLQRYCVLCLIFTHSCLPTHTSVVYKLQLTFQMWFLMCSRFAAFVKATWHIPFHASAVPLPCHVAEGLDCVFPIWFTQGDCVWFTHTVPCPWRTPAMLWSCRSESDFSRPWHSMAWHV